MAEPNPLRELMKKPGMRVGPGVYDCLSARLAQQAGFELIFSSGYGIAASRLGVPDIGLLSGPEMLAAAGAIAQSVTVPLIADMDTGYGGALNVIHTVSTAIRQGVCGVILEDQEWPKRCGHLEGKSVVPAEEHAARIRAAVHARGELGSDLVIVARTDARQTHGLQEAIARGRLYRAAGADVIFVEAPHSREELAQVAIELAGVALLVNIVEGGKTPPLPFAELEEMGFKIAVTPLSALFEATHAIRVCFEQLLKQGGAKARPVGFDDFKEVVGTRRLQELEKGFLS